MKTLLNYLEELEGKTIESVEIDGGYSPNIVIKTNDDCILIMSISASWDRCGDYEGCEVEIERNLGYYEKEKYDLLTEADIEAQIKIEEKRRIEREKREAEEKKKAEAAAEKMKKSELELLAKLKEKYEKL